MVEARIQVRLELAAPVLTVSTALGQLGIDSPFARNSSGRPEIPDSLVIGRVRESLAVLGSLASSDSELTVGFDVDDIAKLFGNGCRGGRLVPDAKKFSSSGFELQENPKPSPRARVRIDADRGAADEGMLEFAEELAPSGTSLTFAGTIEFVAMDRPTAERWARMLYLGFCRCASFGAERSSGFGRLQRVGFRVRYNERQAPSTVAQTGSCASRYLLTIIPDKPICLSRRPAYANLFESTDFIAGGAIRGTLSRMLLNANPTSDDEVRSIPRAARFGTLAANFSRLRITHGFPTVRGGVRPLPPPLSTVAASGAVGFGDVALSDAEGLVSPPGGPPSVPSFQVDWKGETWCAVNAATGTAAPRRELRVRTEIDRSRRKAKDERLFAYEMIVPDELQWFSHLDLSGVPESERMGVFTQLLDLLGSSGELNGVLRGLGKTKARAQLQLKPEAPVATPAPPRENRWIVRLVAPALMADPFEVPPHGSKSLHDVYQEAINSQLRESGYKGAPVSLARFFASQSLLGGYLALRYPLRDRREYYPYMVTDTGSVFVLKVDGLNDANRDEVSKILATWETSGAPLPAWVHRRYGDSSEGDRASWRTCPFLPQDGFGEVLINSPWHWDHRWRVAP